MSHKYFREEFKTNASKNLSVVSKCLVIVLNSKSRQNSGDVLDREDADSTIIDPNNGDSVRPSDVHKAPNPNGYNGKELLRDFKMKNKTCYWNPSLVESIKSLEYKGFVEPSTILVTAADIHLENLRSAWGRRVLKAPSGFTIERIGELFEYYYMNINLMRHFYFSGPLLPLLLKGISRQLVFRSNSTNA